LTTEVNQKLKDKNTLLDALYKYIHRHISPPKQMKNMMPSHMLELVSTGVAVSLCGGISKAE